MDARPVPAAGGVGADASSAASDDPPAAAVEFGPRAEAAEHAEVVDQEERDLDGCGWCHAILLRCGCTVVGVTLLVVYTASLPSPTHSILPPGVYLSI